MFLSKLMILHAEMRRMNAAKLLLQILKEHDIRHVFGLPGETTLPLYAAWQDLEPFPIEHVLARDERSAVFMADAYARVSFQPGVCESPSVGSTHLVPGVVEAYKASVPMLVFTSDCPLHLETRNMLTSFNQTALFQGITKDTITVTKGSEIPNILRRAFRIATTGKPGPVHVRLPMDILEEEIDDSEIDTQIYAQKDFTKYPGHRPIAGFEKINEALNLLYNAERPVLICGQGVLYSQAWDEVTEFAELFGVPVGTTITGKGSIAETHPLSIGVIGSRGGTRFSNKIVRNADLIFYIGCNTDSAGTSKWTLPAQDSDTKIIHLDISGVETGNNYRTDVVLIGDAKATLSRMIKVATIKITPDKYEELPRIKQILKEAKEYNEFIKEVSQSDEKPVHPMRFIQELVQALPNEHILVTDPGISAIYPSAFYKVRKAGRSIIFNYALGALGYAIPASVGAYYAKPESCIVALTGDGSYGFSVGEFETISRMGGNINIILFNNRCYGWIKAELQASYGSKYVDFSTNFKEIDYQKIAEGFGLVAFKVEKAKDLSETLQKAVKLHEPTFTELIVKPENELIPPVPSWVKKAEEIGLKYVY
ncbi:MAG: thiamine pyrophosphate-binding protein [Candidatus Heimdallarchaeota archaeon]